MLVCSEFLTLVAEPGIHSRFRPTGSYRWESSFHLPEHFTLYSGGRLTSRQDNTNSASLSQPQLARAPQQQPLTLLFQFSALCSTCSSFISSPSSPKVHFLHVFPVVVNISCSCSCCPLSCCTCSCLSIHATTFNHNATGAIGR